MKFGTFFLLQRPEGLSDVQVYKNEAEQMEASEALGFDSVWLAEHHFQWYGICPDLMVMGAWVAARTKRVRIGTAIVVLPFHNPVRLAEQAAMLDILSDGRLDFGVGRGYQAAEYGGFGLSMDESRVRFRECLDVIVEAWTKESFSYQGRFTQADNVTLLPKPVQKPHPPIFVASWMSAETIGFAAERGYPILSPAGLAADQLNTNYQMYRDALKALGREGSDYELPALVHIYVDEDRERGERLGLEYSIKYGASLVTLGTPVQKGGALSREYADYAEFGQEGRVVKETRQELMLFGDPETVARKVQWLRDELGVNYLLCWMNMGGLPQPQVLKSMELFAREVMPAFRQPSGVRAGA